MTSATTRAPVLEGERVTLRLATRRDADEIARFYRENDLHLCAFETPKPRTWLSPGFWRGEIERLQESCEVGASCRLFVFPRGPVLGEPPRAVIGTAGLTSIVRGVLQGAWVGYSLAERTQGRGVMHEALGLLVEFAFGPLNLHRLMASHVPRNEKSGRVLEHLGFRPEGVAPDYLFLHGRWEDHVVSSLLNPRWRVPPGFLRRDAEGRVVEVPSDPGA